MREFKAPNRHSDVMPLRIFLAGSIGLDKPAEQWQSRVVEELKEYNVFLYNPRRDDWDSSWVQDPTKGTQFTEQVEWELEHIDDSDMVLFYFDPETTSPITLMELGIVLGTGKDVIIMCPQKFHRYGNVVVTARHFGVDVHINENDWMDAIKLYLNEYEITNSEEEFVDVDVKENVDISDESVIVEDSESSAVEEEVAHVTVLSASSNIGGYLAEKYGIGERNTTDE